MFLMRINYASYLKLQIRFSHYSDTSNKTKLFHSYCRYMHRYSAVQISSDSGAIIQLFAKLKFLLQKTCQWYKKDDIIGDKTFYFYNHLNMIWHGFHQS